MNIEGFEISYYAPIDFEVVKIPVNSKCTTNISEDLKILGGEKSQNS